jgi:hypothetical protein
LAEQMLDAAALRELLWKTMVGPAAQREAVAHLKAELGLSERRLLDRQRQPHDDPLPVLPATRTPSCASNCASSPTVAGALVIAGCSSCGASKATRDQVRSELTGIEIENETALLQAQRRGYGKASACAE